MRDKINDFVNKLQNNKELIDKVKSNKRNILIGVGVVLLLFVVIGSFSGSHSDNNSKPVTSNSNNTKIVSDNKKQSNVTIVSNEDFNIVKKCMYDLFFTDPNMRRQVNLDCYTKGFQDTLGTEKFKVFSLMCKTSLNPMYKPTQDEIDLLSKYNGINPVEGHNDKLMEIMFECRK